MINFALLVGSLVYVALCETNINELINFFPFTPKNDFYNVLHGNNNKIMKKSYSNFKSPRIENYKIEIPPQLLANNKLSNLQKAIIRNILSDKKVVTDFGNIFSDLDNTSIGDMILLPGDNSFRGIGDSILNINGEKTNQNGYVTYEESQNLTNGTTSGEGRLIEPSDSKRGTSEGVASPSLPGGGRWSATHEPKGTSKNLKNGGDTMIKTTMFSIIVLFLMLN